MTFSACLLENSPYSCPSPIICAYETRGFCENVVRGTCFVCQCYEQTFCLLPVCNLSKQNCIQFEKTHTATNWWPILKFVTCDSSGQHFTISSFHHSTNFIISSFHHFIIQQEFFNKFISSFHHFIIQQEFFNKFISSFHHFIIQHFIISSFHHSTAPIFHHFSSHNYSETASPDFWVRLLVTQQPGWLLFFKNPFVRLVTTVNTKISGICSGQELYYIHNNEFMSLNMNFNACLLKNSPYSCPPPIIFVYETPRFL